jgi:hypothetical protein
VNLSELKAQVWERIDDAPADLTVIKWFDNAQNRLASACNAKFPKFVTNSQFDPNVSPVFDEKWHEALVVFACARYKEAESSLSEVANFAQQFEELKAEMMENYIAPLQYRDDRLVQQFTATVGQTDFTITKLGYTETYGNLRAFVNGLETKDFTHTNDGTNQFTINSPVLSVGDDVTALWEEHYEYTEPPYPWW